MATGELGKRANGRTDQGDVLPTQPEKSGFSRCKQKKIAPANREHPVHFASSRSANQKT